MLTKFAVKNYRGFGERIVWDLSNPGNYAFSGFAIRDGIVKNGIVYGPNGSGKTNLSLSVMDIVNHLSQKWKKPDYYANFSNAAVPDNPVEFEYTFCFGDLKIDYEYSKDASGVLLSECMFLNGQELFCRKGTNLRLDKSQFPIEESVMANLAENANKISIVNYLLASYPLSADNALILLQRFVNSMLWFRCVDTREFIGLETRVINVEEYIIKNSLLEDFSSFLCEVSGQDFLFAKPASGDKHIMCVQGGHIVPFWKIISTGTISLTILYYWIKEMDKASFVFIDEFDAFYHYRLSYEVCKRLFSLNCQVFLSSHNTYLMTNELLRPDCNFLLDRGQISPLCECTEKELRFGHNIEKMFRGKAFKL